MLRLTQCLCLATLVLLIAATCFADDIVIEQEILGPGNIDSLGMEIGKKTPAKLEWKVIQSRF